MSILHRLPDLGRRLVRPATSSTSSATAAPRLSQRLGFRLQNSRFASAPGGSRTLANLIHLDAEPVWVRLLFVNDQPEPWTLAHAAIAPTAAANGPIPICGDGRPDPGLWRPVTFEAGGADSAPPLDPTGGASRLVIPGNPLDPSRPVHAWSDWCPITALPRRDGGFGFLLLVRGFSHGAMRFAASMGGPDPSIGRLHAGFVAMGDADPVTASSFQSDDKLFACHGVQIITPTPGVTVVGIGDSITNSSCTTGEVSGFGIRACTTISRAARPVTYVNEAFPGRHSLGFSATGLLTVEAFRPQIATIQAWTPNEPWTEAMAILAFQRAIAVADAVRRHGGVPILTTAVPAFGALPDAEPARLASNARVRALAEQGWPVLDIDAIWGTGGSPNRLRPAFDAGDALHPNNRACAEAARVLAVMLERILSDQ